MYTVHSNTIYPWFLSKTKPKLVVLHRHRSRCSRSITCIALRAFIDCLRLNSTRAPKSVTAARPKIREYCPQNVGNRLSGSQKNQKQFLEGGSLPPLYNIRVPRRAQNFDRKICFNWDESRI